MSPLPRWPLLARMGVAATLGALAAFGLAPWGLWPVTLAVLLAVPALFLSASSTRQAALIGWALGAGWFAHGLIWIVEPFLVDVARYGWMAPFALGLMANGGGLFWAVAFGAAHRFGRGHGSRIALLMLAWSLSEFARAYIFTGFPWAGLAQIWPGNDVALLLAWIGPQGLALITLLATLLPGWTFTRQRHLGLRLVSVVPAVGLVMVSYALAVQTRPDATPMTGKIVRLVQPNAPQHQKWDPQFRREFFDRMIAFTQEGPRDDLPGPPDLIVWPETALAAGQDDFGATAAYIADAAAGTPLVFGVLRYEGQRAFNSLAYLDADGRVAGRYDKHHLVPFGEYVPFGDLMARFGIHGFASQAGFGMSGGPGPQLLDLGDLGRALPLICYEVVFPQDVGGTTERPDFLLQITNDAWFGGHSGPYQHLAQARMRAIEQGLPMIRVANTGVSAMIDPWGRLTASLPLGEAGYVDAELPAALVPTLYARTGDTPVLILLLIATFGLMGLQSRRKGSI